MVGQRGDMSTAETTAFSMSAEDISLIKKRIREARQHFSEMNFDQAREVLESSIVLDPHHPDLLHNLGSLYLMQSLMDESISCYRKALANDPAHIESGIGLSKAFIATQRYEEALEALQSVRQYLDRPSDQAEFYKLIGMLSSLRDDTTSALSFFEKYRDYAPDSADPYHCLYTTYIQKKNFEQAEAVLEQLVGKFPKDRVARIRQLDLWAQRDAIDKLNPALDRLLRDSRNSPAACETAVQYYLKTHQLAYAARTVARLTRQTPVDLNAWPFLKRAATLLP